MSLKSEYIHLARTDREEFLRKARQNAELTIPDLYPPEGYDGHSDLPDPNQHIGAQGVNNLSSKLTYILLPISTPFFRYNISEESLIEAYRKEYEATGEQPDLKQLGKQVQEVVTESEAALHKKVESIIEEAENAAVRVALGEAVKHLVVSGNALIDIPEEGSARFIPLTNYIVRRDGYGDVVCIIIKESVIVDNIEDKELRERITSVLDNQEEEGTKEPVDVFKGYTLKNNVWEHVVEVNEEEIVSKKIDKNRLPVIPLRLYKMDGQNYGRAFVSEYRALLAYIDSLQKCVRETSVAKARMLMLVRNASTTDLKKMNEAKNLEFVKGEPEDIVPLSFAQHNSDAAVVTQELATAMRTASAIFMINAGYMREGERVTAEEVRFRAEQLDDAQGGIYSILALELQPKLIDAIEARLGSKSIKVPEEVATVSIVAGLEALGRNHKLQQLRVFAQTVAEIYGPEALASTSHLNKGIQKIANMVGIDWDEVTKTEEELAAERQQAQQQALIEKLGPNAVNQAGNLISQQTQQAVNAA